MILPPDPDYRCLAALQVEPDILHGPDPTSPLSFPRTPQTAPRFLVLDAASRRAGSWKPAHLRAALTLTPSPEPLIVFTSDANRSRSTSRPSVDTEDDAQQARARYSTLKFIVTSGLF